MSLALNNLNDVRVLVTRSRAQGSALAALLEASGATTIALPTIELAPPASYCGLDAAIVTLRAFDWLIFTSANAVQAVAARAARLQLPAEPKRVAVIGSATAAAALAAFGRAPDLMPQQFVAEALAEALQPHASGAAMLLVRAAVARDVLPDALRAAGAQLTVAEAYRTVIPAASVDELRRLMRENPPDAITFTSASTAQNFCALLEAAEVVLPERVVLASIGPVTSAAMRELGLRVAVEAREATVASLVDGLVAFYLSEADPATRR